MNARLFGLTTATAVLLALMPGQAGAMWGDDNCTGSTSNVPVSATTRASARAYTDYIRLEGYHWGGGCANTNNADDQPGQVPQTPSPRGEGPDCSGLVFRTWGLGSSSGTTAFYTHYQYGFVHGPFVAASYRSSTTAWTVISKTSLPYMAAVASTGHVALYEGTQADGSALYFEAKAEAEGSGVWSRTYRSDSSYTAARRNGWTG